MAPSQASGCLLPLQRLLHLLSCEEHLNVHQILKTQQRQKNTGYFCMWKVCVNEKTFLLTNKLTNSYEDIHLKKKTSIKVWSSLHIFPWSQSWLKQKKSPRTSETRTWCSLGWLLSTLYRGWQTLYKKKEKFKTIVTLPGNTWLTNIPQRAKCVIVPEVTK